MITSATYSGVDIYNLYSRLPKNLGLNPALIMAVSMGPGITFKRSVFLVSNATQFVKFDRYDLDAL